MDINLIVKAFERAEEILTRESSKYQARLRKWQNEAHQAIKSGKLTMNSRREKAIKTRIGEATCGITEVVANLDNMNI